LNKQPVPLLWQRVKGKQVQDLCDLVTVSGLKPSCKCSHCESGKATVFGNREPGNLPVWTVREKIFSGSRGIDRTIALLGQLGLIPFTILVKGFFRAVRFGFSKNGTKGSRKYRRKRIV